MKLNGLIAICAALCIIYPCMTQANNKVPDSSLLWADRLLLQTHPPFGADGSMRIDAESAENAFNAIINKYGPNGRVLVGLGKSQQLLGKHDKAVSSFEKADRLSPGNTAIRYKLQCARELAEVTKSAIAKLPKQHTILQTAEYPIPGHNKQWLVLSAIKSDGTWPDYSSVKLTLFSAAPNNLRTVWQSENLGFPHSKGEDNFNDVRLYVFDMNGDGISEAVVPQIIIGASWTPTHLDVFEWQNGRMTSVLGVSSDEPPEVRSLSRDGRYQVINIHAIGYSICHAAQPRWQNVYDYKDGNYQLATGDYPYIIRMLQRDILRELDNNPKDFELLEYLGITYQMQKRLKVAERTFTRAEKLCKNELRQETDPGLRTRLAWKQNDIQHRIYKVRKKLY